MEGRGFDFPCFFLWNLDSNQDQDGRSSVQKDSFAASNETRDTIFNCLMQDSRATKIQEWS
jgi:hypothetical protein